MNTGHQVIARLQQIRDDADSMLCMFDRGGDDAHAFWLHVDVDALGECCDKLEAMFDAMRDEVAREY